MTKIFKNASNDTCAADASPGVEWAEITHTEYLAICEQKRIIPDPASLIEAKKQSVRTARKLILDILTGIATAASLTGDKDTTDAYLAVLQGLKDITEDWPADPALIDAVVVARYDDLVALCTPQMVSAFAQVAS